MVIGGFEEPAGGAWPPVGAQYTVVGTFLPPQPREAMRKIAVEG